MPRARRRAGVPLLIGGAVLVALLAAAGITYAVVAGQRSPEGAASAFLDELVARDAAAAQSLLAGIPAGNPVLLQPDTYAAVADPIDSYRVLDSRRDGATAAVTVEVEQGGESYSHELSLSLVRRDLGLFDVWRVDGSNLPTVYVTYARPEGMALTVNGAEFGGLTGAYDLDVPAFPGTYTFEPTGTTEFYTAEAVTLTLRFGEPGTSSTAAIPVTLTESGAAAATTAVSAALDACLAQAALQPGPNCGFGVVQDDATYSNIRWTLLARPTVTFGEFVEGEGWAVIPASPGSMRFDADYETPSESGTAESTISDFEQGGTIRSIDDGVAVFESWDYH